MKTNIYYYTENDTSSFFNNYTPNRVLNRNLKKCKKGDTRQIANDKMKIYIDIYYIVQYWFWYGYIAEDLTNLLCDTNI